jgi:hypothetical protein
LYQGEKRTNVRIIMRSLHEVHGENALRAGRVCLSTIQLEHHWTDSDEFLVWVFYLSRLPQNRTFEYPTIGDNKMTDEESREVDRE